jgi:hypothetical protein
MEQSGSPKNLLSDIGAPTAAAQPVTEEPGIMERIAKSDIVKSGVKAISTKLLDPVKIAEDPNVDPEIRLAADQEVTAREQAAADAAAAERSRNAQRYLNALQTAESLNARMVQRYGEGTDKLVKLPAPEKFGTSAADVATYTAQTVASPGIKQKTDEELNDEKRRAELAEIQKQQMDMVEADLARQNASLAAQANYGDRMRRLMDEKIAQIDAQQEQIDQIDPQRFWNSRSAPQQILGALAVALGEAGRSLTRSSTNTALDIINDAIKRDFDAQKITGDQRLLKEQNALRRIDAEINKFSQLSQDQLRRSQLEQIQAGLRQQQMQLKQRQAQMMMRAAITKSGNGVDPDTARMLYSEDEMERAVALPNGNMVIAPVSAKAVQEVRKDLATDAALLNHFSKLTSMAKNYNKLDLRERAAMDSQIKLTVGNLKKLVGESGAMTERDREFILSSLGDPNWTPNALALPRFKAIEDSIKNKVSTKYRSIGVNLPESVRERKFREAKALSPDSSDEAINAALDKKGL